ncbi:hypothetical protein JST97_34680 [bacterium]|nr:hypothetical protein [bacterium]
MRKTWIDRVLSQLAKLQSGSGDRQALRDAVRTTRDGFEQQLAAFRVQWPQNPEITQPEASAIEGPLVVLLERLTALEEVLGSGSPQDWSAWIGRIRPPLVSLRSARQRLSAGPTSNQLVNRLLRHLTSWRAGRPADGQTGELLEAARGLENEWDAIIAQLPADQQELLWIRLDPVLSILEEWRAGWQGLAPSESVGWEAEIVASLRAFDQKLAELMEADLAGGPTSFPVVNLLLGALEQGLWPQAQELARSAGQLFSLQVAPDTLAISELPEWLQKVESLGEETQPEELSRVQSQLIACSQELARLHQAEHRPEGLIDVRSRDQGPGLELPPMLASIFQLAEDCVAGRRAGESLRPGITQLEQVVQRFSSSRGPAAADVALAIEDLTDTLEVLRDLEVSPSQALLSELEEILHNCAQSLGALQT